MKKPEVSQRMYEEWDELKEKLDKYDAEYKAWNKRVQKHMKEMPNILSYDILFPPKPVTYKDAHKLFTTLSMLPKALSGRNRKRDEELVLVPRGVMRYIMQCAIMGVPSEKKYEARDNEKTQEGTAI